MHCAGCERGIVHEDKGCIVRLTRRRLLFALLFSGRLRGRARMRTKGGKERMGLECNFCRREEGLEQARHGRRRGQRATPGGVSTRGRRPRRHGPRRLLAHPISPHTARPARRRTRAVSVSLPQPVRPPSPQVYPINTSPSYSSYHSTHDIRYIFGLETFDS